MPIFAHPDRPAEARRTFQPARRDCPSPPLAHVKSGPASPLPDGLRTGAEALSGFSLANVRVHHDSSEPARLGALAFALGSEIHLGPGQARHLPHETWHVVQQMQGRATEGPQMQGGGQAKQPALETEADQMAKQTGEVVPLTGDASDCAAALIAKDGTPLNSVFARRMDLFDGLPTGSRYKCTENAFFADAVCEEMERVLKQVYGWKWKKLSKGLQTGLYRFGTPTMWVGGEVQGEDYVGMGEPGETMLAALKAAIQTVAPDFLKTKK